MEQIVCALQNVHFMQIHKYAVPTTATADLQISFCHVLAVDDRISQLLTSAGAARSAQRPPAPRPRRAAGTGTLLFLNRVTDACAQPPVAFPYFAYTVDIYVLASSTHLSFG